LKAGWGINLGHRVTFTMGPDEVIIMIDLADDEEVHVVLTRAELHELLRNMPDGSLH
jgi:ABC-type multidrug transport system fused ATPase/permease subunit